MKISYLFACIAAFLACSPKTPQQRAVSPADRGEIRVLSYNIHHANPPSKTGLIDIQAIADVLREQQPDIIGLQEVDVNTGRSGKSLNQAAELARLTGMNFYFARAIDYDGGHYGISILSRYPITDARTYELPSAAGTNGEPRVLATAQINLPGGQKLLFANTHLDAQRNDTNRLLQINAITEILKTEDLPVVITGDFNAEPGSAVMNISDRHFQRTCIGDDCGFTIPVINPRKTIDFIAFAPKNKFSVLKHQVITGATYASDHLPVFSVLKLN